MLPGGVGYMADELKQVLSEAIDDELRGSQTRFLVSRLLADREMCGRWERYQLIGEVLRGSVAGNRWHPEFSDGVMAALDTEPAHQSRSWGRSRQLLAAGLAASIALVALVGTVQWFGSDPVTGSGVSQVAAQTESSGFSMQLNEYIAGHQELMAISGGQGMVPYARLTSDFQNSGEQQ